MWANDNGMYLGAAPGFFPDPDSFLDITDIDGMGDVSMDLADPGLAWYNWMDFAKGMERDGRPSTYQ